MPSGTPARPRRASAQTPPHPPHPSFLTGQDLPLGLFPLTQKLSGCLDIFPLLFFSLSLLFLFFFFFFLDQNKPTKNENCEPTFFGGECCRAGPASPLRGGASVLPGMLPGHGTNLPSPGRTTKYWGKHFANPCPGCYLSLKRPNERGWRLFVIAVGTYEPDRKSVV